MDDIKHIFDVLSVSAWIGTILGFVSGLTTLAAFVWMCIRIYDGYLSVKLKQRELKNLEKQDDQQPKP